MRYRRDEDRWTSFTSLLLKSLAFYRSVDPGIGTSPAAEEADDLSTRMEKLKIKEKEELPIVDLPRTNYNRPYLPLLDGKSSTSKTFNKAEGVKENFNSMMNVSHQYPWVCMAQQQLRPAEETSKSILIGVDLVIFSARLNNYSPTVDDFLKSFVGSFTPWEWERINRRQYPSMFGRKVSTRPRSDQSKLREFFLRWSMKEAYTKALGLGMNVNFNEVETRLHGVDVDAGADVLSNQDEGIWTSTMNQGVATNCSEGGSLRQFSAVGKVKCVKSLMWKCWEFIFIPLGGRVRGGGLAQDTTALELPRDHESYNSCACICRGPLESSTSNSSERNRVSIELLTVADLIRLHGSNPL